MARRILMALRGDPQDLDSEAEPVVLETDGRDVTLTLDDGIEVTFDAEQFAVELGSAIDEERAARRRRLAA